MWDHAWFIFSFSSFGEGWLAPRSFACLRLVIRFSKSWSSCLTPRHPHQRRKRSRSPQICCHKDQTCGQFSVWFYFGGWCFSAPPSANVFKARFTKAANLLFQDKHLFQGSMFMRFCCTVHSKIKSMWTNLRVVPREPEQMPQWVMFNRSNSIISRNPSW